MSEGQGKRVFTADDEPEVVDLVRMVLDMAGHSVSSAGDGEETLVAIRAELPDLILLDVRMPKMNGLQVLKQLQADPWKQVQQHYRVGELVEGLVTNVVSFGAFVRLEEGIEGLIHISELAEGTFLHPRNVVREGQWIEARVLNIDPVNRRIGLSLRQTRATDDGQEAQTTGHLPEPSSTLG